MSVKGLIVTDNCYFNQFGLTVGVLTTSHRLGLLWQNKTALMKAVSRDIRKILIESMGRANRPSLLGLMPSTKAHFDLGNNKGTIDNILSQLGSAFALKDLEPINYFLGIEIVPHAFNILLSQKKYNLGAIYKVLVKISTNSGISLQYVTLSWPDIAFTVNKVFEHGMLIRRSSGFTLQAFTDVLWKGNPDTSLEAFSDADWAGDSDDRWSTGRFAIYLGSNLISWTARKQRTVSRSSTEVEYKALADTVAELTWLQALLYELAINSTRPPPATNEDSERDEEDATFFLARY
ncbi:retrovirus-related pol polyprotein from transposon TNT 1-94 [Tanacetum coccineum]